MSFAARLEAELAQFKQDGVYKRLNYLEAPQAARTKMQGRGEVVILSSNNYLGLCNAPDVVARSEEHTSELQSRLHLVCRLLLEKNRRPGRDPARLRPPHAPR